MVLPLHRIPQLYFFGLKRDIFSFNLLKLPILNNVPRENSELKCHKGVEGDTILVAALADSGS